MSLRSIIPRGVLCMCVHVYRVLMDILFILFGLREIEGLMGGVNDYDDFYYILCYIVSYWRFCEGGGD